MKEITKCLNEWNVIIESLGQGKQTILIRNYGTNLTEFLLYPTVSYVLKDGYIQSFQSKYHEFVKFNDLPKRNEEKSEVKYFAKVEKVFETNSYRIGNLKNYYIWTSKHVKSYLNTRKAHVWVLRVYELESPIMAERTKGLRYANLLEKVSLEGIKPVISDKKFLKLVSEIN
jgi:hypothetical protein